MPDEKSYDVVIVGAGLAGSLIAHKLGTAGLKVLILEAGRDVPASREDYMERFYLQLAKVPESPYAPNPNAPRPTVLDLAPDGGWKNASATYLDQSDSKLPFSSTYERRGGGTMWHWLGSSFRFLPNDFKLQSCYQQGIDWPIRYEDLGQARPGRATAYYDDAETEIGVSADVAHQQYLGLTFRPGYQYPNPEIPTTLTDDWLTAAVNGKMQFDGQPVTAYPTPAGRNSRPYDGRRVCAGNTNCIPICPIQAKYDPTISLNKALDTGNVEVRYQSVASKARVDDDKKKIVGIDYIHYADQARPSPDGTGTAVGRIYVIATHAIEAPKLLLNSRDQIATGVANSSDQVGRNLMDHPLYLTWGLSPTPTYPYRGPLATAGIESLRDGPFRAQRAAFRVEFGNEGWNFTSGDPETTTLDFVDGRKSKLNPQGLRLSGVELLRTLNDIYTCQFRFGFLVEQSPCADNRVTPSNLTDDLGIPRPKIAYDLSDYTKRGFVAAEKLTEQIFDKAGVNRFQKDPEKLRDDAGYFTYTDPKTGQTSEFEYFGSGHIVGTCRMGDKAGNSVVDAEQRSWDHPNMFIVGSTVFPTVATGNPSLTIAALALWAADTIKGQLAKGV